MQYDCSCPWTGSGNSTRTKNLSPSITQKLRFSCTRASSSRRSRAATTSGRRKVNSISETGCSFPHCVQSIATPPPPNSKVTGRGGSATLTPQSLAAAVRCTDMVRRLLLAEHSLYYPVAADMQSVASAVGATLGLESEPLPDALGQGWGGHSGEHGGPDTDEHRPPVVAESDSKLGFVAHPQLSSPSIGD